jgi:hypothetical protein
VPTPHTSRGVPLCRGELVFTLGIIRVQRTKFEESRRSRDSGIQVLTVRYLRHTGNLADWSGS